MWRRGKKRIRQQTVCVCVSEVCSTRAQTETAYFFPQRHEVLVGFEDVRQSLPDVFLLHAGQHGGRQEQRETPLLPVESRLTIDQQGRPLATDPGSIPAVGSEESDRVPSPDCRLRICIGGISECQTHSETSCLCTLRTNQYFLHEA